MNENLSSHLIKLILSKQNYSLDIASTTQEAIEILDNNIYDYIIISDKETWVVPEDLVRNIRRLHNENKESTIFYLSEEINDTYRNTLIKKGVDDFLKIPLNKTEFLEKLDKVSGNTTDITHDDDHEDDSNDDAIEEEE